MNSERAYGIWAPEGSPYSPWVKPILFASEQDWSTSRHDALPQVSEPTWLLPDERSAGYREGTKDTKSRDLATVHVVDLPGKEGVGYGVALARLGWRPIPLYNAVPGGIPFVPPRPGAPNAPLPWASSPMDSSSLVDMHSIIAAMRAATPIVAKLALASERPPAFLLDADRRFGVGGAIPGRFDNRSVSLPTDFPSSIFLRSRGIERVVLIQQRATEPQEDLAHTLLAWQQGGLVIQAKSLANDSPPEPIEVSRPTHFRAMWQRFLATLGLKRNPLGGFGGTIPEPSAG